ncbi:MAG: hypothetical protein WD207_02725 [Xanthobacteraceae bacterium]
MSAVLGSKSPHALDGIKRELDEIALAPAVRERVRDHYEDLTKLAATLHKLGIAEQEIDRHVLEIFGQYRVALLRNIERMTSV